MKKSALIAIALSGAMIMAHAAAYAAPDVSLTVDADRSGAKISPLLYGIFYEEINRAGDGGLYAEMLENRSFEDNANLVAWSTNGKATLSLDKSRALNAKNPTALKIVAGAGGGAINAGFKGAGLFVRKDHAYIATFYARSLGQNYGPLDVRLENRNGVVLGRARVAQIGNGWKQYRATVTSNANDDQARLVIQGGGAGTFYLDQVSLMPQKTWKNTALRVDLAARVAAMKPAFVRFPGGCFVEGDKMANATRWKETIGDPAQRPGHSNLWGYRSTDGFGVHEWLRWCEEMKSEPLYVINCGMAHEDHIPMDKMGPLVQDALDLLEYARGPVTSRYGAMRAQSGHPKPFKLHYLEIGNENGGPLYNERYALFYDALKAKYPDVNLVANVWNGTPTSRPLEIIDEHYYSTPGFFRSQAHRYDDYNRKGPKIYVGEYAVTQESGKGNMAAALGEAAFMTGLERNADIVKMASYAPLLVNPEWARWNPNAIVFDQSRSYGTPSYWTQVLFGNNHGDVIVPMTLESGTPAKSQFAGGIGLGTWATQVEFKDVRVERDGKVLYASDFSASDGLDGWRFRGRGDWKIVDGALRQSSRGEDVHALIGDASWGSDYTLTLRARKISGNEGFLISFQKPGDSAKHWWNLGGWGNSAHGLEITGTDRRVAGQIETDRWYDIRIEARDETIRCYLDGQLVQSATQKPVLDVFAVASRTDDGKNLILKLVNASTQPMQAAIVLRGTRKFAPMAQLTTLQSQNPLDENTFERPNNIAPQTRQIKVSKSFNHTLPANSISIVRLKTN